MPSLLCVLGHIKGKVIKSPEQREEEARRDALFLSEMGYPESLYRGFSSFMSFALGFNVVSVLISITIYFDESMKGGGSGVAIWSWIIGSIFTILISLSLAEMCSVYPSAGAVYHWSGKLVSPRYAPIASFVCGWFNFVGNAAGVATFSSGFVKILDSAIILGGNESLSDGAKVGIGIAITFFWGVQNILRIDHQGWINSGAAFLQMGSVVIIAVVLGVKNPNPASANHVFTSTNNDNGFSLGYVYCIGILSTVFCFSGYEAGAHLAEETRGASRTVPRGIVGTCVCSAIFGAIYLLTLLVAVPDAPKLMKDYSDSNTTVYLATFVFKEIVSHTGALLLTILLLLNVHLAGVASMTVASRIGYAMARDDIFPFSNHLRWVFERTKAPLAMTLLLVVIDSLLLLLQLASSEAFKNLLSLTVLGYQISYFMPIFFRCMFARNRFPMGDFDLGRFGVPIGVISCIWLFVTSVFALLPTEYPVTKNNMNYAMVIIGGVGCIAAVYWFASARHRFVGPKITKIDPIDLPFDTITPAASPSPAS